MRILILIALAAATLADGSGASDACYGGTAVISASDEDTRDQFIYGVQASFSGPLPQKRPRALALAVAEPIDACQDLHGADSLYSGKVLVAARGTCSFTEKAKQAHRAGAAILLVYNTQPGCLVIGAASNETESRDIPVVGISEESGHQLVALAHDKGSIRCWAPVRAPLDPAAGLIWTLAVSTVAIGAIWAGHDFSAGRQSQHDGGAVHGRRSQGSPQAGGAVEVQMVSGVGAIAFVVVASVMLVVLYFLLNHIFALVLIVLFTVASFQSLAIVFAAWIGAAFPKLKLRKVDCGRWLGSSSCHSLAAIPPAVCWIAAWFVSDPTSWGWIFQDGMGIAIMLQILRQFMLPDLKVASLLLLLFFVYDIFWVFIQPLLTKGPSVMVEVASGGSTHETVPMLLRVPSLWGPPYSTSILGYGDVVLPGLLIVFTRIWDCAFQKPPAASYFWPLLAGYCSGLLATFAALVAKVGGSKGQPALLYLVPCTLGLCAALAWRRKDLRAMWRGIDATLAELKRTHSSETGADIESATEDLESPGEPLLLGQSISAGPTTRLN